MVVSKLKHLGKQSLFALAIVMTVGGFKAVSTFVKTADAVVTQPQTTSISATAVASEFSVCSEASDWRRPSQDQQQKQLSTDERYSTLLQDKDFQQLANQFWQHDILSFTTYGLSARMEPVNLSGLWSVADDVWTNCYSRDESIAINEGRIAEAWVMNHRVMDVSWAEDHYVMVLEPAQQGMQVVQFTRHETEAELPLTVITTQGTMVEHHVADW
ncbi:hypothetical protein [Leptothoe spongobia]|uniref:Uncharacterized protein n=1 Tax=Leptothoe spongobia TAU-MAC 1115 TaxID=1967444 RepID=A0A947DDU2_9CYAN|nr:hypothetical protein [Leptothoe spongobia]MBT9315005.1 hypothetical protein [Leptothoe spongobia TAU-MAC 1115]